MTREEMNAEASSFLARNGSIIYYLPRRENALNSYIKEAFIAGIELGEKRCKEEILDRAKRELDSKNISSEEGKLIFRIFPELCKSDYPNWICWLEKQKKQNFVLESTCNSDGYNSSISSQNP